MMYREWWIMSRLLMTCSLRQFKRFDGLEHDKVPVRSAQARQDDDIDPVEHRMALGGGHLRTDERERLEGEAEAVRLAECLADQSITHETCLPHEPPLRQCQRTVQPHDFVHQVAVLGPAEHRYCEGMRQKEARATDDDGNACMYDEQSVQASSRFVHRACM
ncbi:hypothetical protein H257_15359 [Aphanomyces astaci]|uniref:Uncharacterized protein n=1 Tax=Aphanomyces astaci TaxID=112090 RepID=W4FMP9_APHAT|nr:hypothetical protein H257_15359 [Aphanomyces astaci]ETV68797.1 hypothetical protein H257_15359 [Aphanomyces astaci]|eukprot:XP_009841751.1 hypothetical protein H257_15359 [Aphanomyces astaci]